MAIDAQMLPAHEMAAPKKRSASTGAELLVATLFTATALVGSALLFVVEPLIAKLLLPSYGGSATVWSTSTLFFQVLLLIAYAYAHWSTTRLGPRRQPGLHFVVLLLPLTALPLAIPQDAAPAADASPALWLLRTLVLVVGLPFAVVATTGPLLQRWYSWTSARRAHDPYFLFAASNLGSFGGLLAYPLFIEPNLSLADQRSWWSAAFVVFVLLTGACGLVAFQNGRRIRFEAGGTVDSPEATEPLSRRRVLRWAALAFLPSSLMLGVTAHLSTDVAAIPLLWVVPLAIYLATFVLAFSRSSRTAPLGVTRVAVAAGFVAVLISLLPAGGPIVAALMANLTMLALVAYAAHARLASDRPETRHLTAFYLVVATGGALGGLLNGLVAPLVFDRVLEYPLALMATPLLLLGLLGGRDTWLGRQFRANRVRAALVVATIAIVALAFRLVLWKAEGDTTTVWALLAIGLLLGWWFSQQPVALAIAVVVLYAVTAVGDTRGTLEQTRTFFGSYRVEQTAEKHVLTHGTTVHGNQFREASRRGVATTYYSPHGPLGDIFAKLDGQSLDGQGLDGGSLDRVAAVGLGAGTVAAYGREGQTMTFFEIDPEIVRIARDPELFTYLTDSKATIRTVVGDGRLRVAEHPAGSFDLVILDAFSSDSIPVHLLTTEAMTMYADRLAPGGVLVVHISNRVFDLRPVVASATADLGWRAAVGSTNTAADGATPSVWVAMSPSEDKIDTLLAEPGWSELDDSKVVRWTDDYSSILSVLR